MVGERDPKFYSELKQMNEDLLSFLKATHEKSPYFDFSPTLTDYVKQIGDLEKQYPEKTTNAVSTIGASITTNNNTSNPTQIPTLSKGASLFSSASPFAPSTTFSSLAPPTSGSIGPTFGSSQTSASQPFLFGAGQAPSLVPTTTSTTSTSFFSFSLPKKDEPATVNSTTNNDASAADAGTEDDAPPPEPKIDKYEEPDSKYSVKCKLYEKGKSHAAGEINVMLVGIGVLFVKALETPNKLQVVFRQEPDLRRVMLNEVITPEIPVKLLPHKAIQMVFPNKTGDTKFYIAKLRDEQEANTLYDMLNLSKS